MFGAGDALCIVLAGNEAALQVAGVSIGVVGGFAEKGDLVGFFVKAQDAVVGDIAEKQTPMICKPHGTFGPAGTGPEAFDSGVADSDFCKAFVQDFDGRVGVADDCRLLGCAHEERARRTV